MKCSFLDYIQLLMIGQAIMLNESWTKCEKSPLGHQKWNAHFWITSNFWWSAEWSKQWKSSEMQKRPPKSSKYEMLIFGLCSTSHDRPSDLNNESRPKREGISMKDYTSGQLCHKPYGYVALCIMYTLPIR